MKTKPFIILLVVLLSSCQFGLPGQSTFTRSGTEGIIVQFLPDAPQTQVYPESEFVIGLEFENRGISDVQRPVYLLSVDDEFVQLV